MPSLSELRPCLTLAFLAAGAQAVASTTTSTAPAATGTFTFEIGAIFPRANETYKATDILPIAFTLRGFDAVREAGGNFTFSWDIMPYSADGIPSGVTYDDREVSLATGVSVHTIPGTPESFVTIVDATNATQWISRKKSGARFMLHWHINWDAFGALRCGYGTSNVFGGVLFGVEAPWEEEDESGPDHGKGVPIDVVASAAGKCPVFAAASEGGSIVEVRPNITDTTCPTVLDGSYDSGSSREADPCKVRIDDAIAKEIAEKATSTALARVPTPTTSAQSSSTNAAERIVPTHVAGAAVAAAGFFVCL